MNVLVPLDLVSEGDFSRGSVASEVVADVLTWRAQHVERAGVLESAARNLCPDAERWDRSGWTAVGIAAPAAAAGMDAPGMAWLLAETATTGRHGIERAIAVEYPGKAHAVSWWVDPGTRPAHTFAVFSAEGDLLGSAHVRWSDLAILASDGVTATAQAFAAGFYRVTLSLALPAAPRIGAYAANAWPPADGLPQTYLGDVGASVVGALCQVELGAPSSPVATEGAIWAPRLVTDVVCNAIEVSGGAWLVGGDGGALKFSADGVVFSGRNSGFGGQAVYAVRKASTHWLIGGAGGAAARSADAVKFSPVTIPAFTGKAIRALFGSSTVLAVGDDGAAASSVSPYTAWTIRTLGLAAGEHALCAAYHAGNWWVGGDQGTLRYSSALTTWATRATGLPAGYALRGLYSDGALLVAVGDFGSIATSADGVTWAVRASGTTRRLTAVTKWDGRWWAVGDRVVLVSADGATWMPRNRPGDAVDARAVAGGAALLVAGARPGLAAYVVGGHGLRAADVPARVTSPVAEDDDPEYSTDESYLVGDIARLAHRRYQALQPSKNVWPPDALDVYWLDLGPTNKWAWSDVAIKTQTVWRDGPLVQVFRPGRRVDELAFLNTVGARLTVEVMDAALTAVKSSQSLALKGGMRRPSWWEFFYAPRAAADNGLMLGLAASSADALRVTIEPLDGEVRLGLLVMGRLRRIGDPLFGTRLGIIDFSVQERDDWGNAVLLKRDYADFMEQDFLIETDRVAQERRFLAELRVTPALWVSAPWSRATYLWGWFEEFSMTIPRWNVSTATISLRGMV